MRPVLREKLDELRQRLRELGSVVVAFSAGVDSAFLLRVATETLGRDRVLAVLGRSASVPQSELRSASDLADECGATLEFIDTREFDDENYLANPENRCYFCKAELYDRLTRLAKERGFGCVVSGVNVDDLADYRPGLQAGCEYRIFNPLAECGITKAELRELGAELGLSIHDKPAAPCLSSRVQYGERITPEVLRRIDQAETVLREFGFRECRVRYHDNLARIEVPQSEIERLADSKVRARVDRELRELGFQYVTLDLRGFRSGSMNEVLPVISGSQPPRTEVQSRP